MQDNRCAVLCLCPSLHFCRQTGRRINHLKAGYCLLDALTVMDPDAKLGSVGFEKWMWFFCNVCSVKVCNALPGTQSKACLRPFQRRDEYFLQHLVPAVFSKSLIEGRLYAKQTPNHCVSSHFLEPQNVLLRLSVIYVLIIISISRKSRGLLRLMAHSIAQTTDGDFARLWFDSSGRVSRLFSLCFFTCGWNLFSQQSQRLFETMF